ncbi:MAG: hypothetical protein FJ198_07600 [Gammaproteobacteria bacterium]|nr:hypothetical protein [Gammaproteobacteria bacterium]MBM4234306.1 hypothetical protein [Gammaproteobacteria bacterium]
MQSKSIERNRMTWRMIIFTVMGALVCWGASLAMLRAFAQDATPPAAVTNEAEEIQRRKAPFKNSDEESPEYRDSADNNISLPIDI